MPILPSAGIGLELASKSAKILGNISCFIFVCYITVQKLSLLIKKLVSHRNPSLDTPKQ
jgi:hypothetical protein